jgi:hypothetical protein
MLLAPVANGALWPEATRLASTPGGSVLLGLEAFEGGDLAADEAGLRGAELLLSQMIERREGRQDAALLSGTRAPAAVVCRPGCMA